VTYGPGAQFAHNLGWKRAIRRQQRVGGVAASQHPSVASAYAQCFVMRRTQLRLHVQSMHVHIRLASMQDAPAIVGLLADLGYAVAGKELASRLTCLVPSVSAVVLVATQTIPLAGNATCVIGFASLSFRVQLRFAGVLATLDELSVAPVARGVGVGRLLCAEAKRIAVERGAARLALLTDRGRESYARGFYVQCGFREDSAAYFVCDLQPAMK
jgi:ribosomal protein S18 acetylase RimI-like enzyme